MDITSPEEDKEFVVGQYHVQSVDKVDAPEGMPGNDWHRYVIAYGNRTIEGMKPGTLFNVTQHAEEFAESLNERTNKYGSQAYRSQKK